MEFIALPLHFLVLACTLAVIALADKEAFAWMRGEKTVLDAVHMRRYHTLVWWGLLGMVATGLLLFWPERNLLLHNNPAFAIKMFFLGVLFINSFAINALMHVALSRPYASLSMKEKLPLLISGALSTISWLGAIALAFFILP